MASGTGRSVGDVLVPQRCHASLANSLGYISLSKGSHHVEMVGWHAMRYANPGFFCSMHDRSHMSGFAVLAMDVARAIAKALVSLR